MDLTTIALTGEELTYLMNGIYLQYDQYKIFGSDYHTAQENEIVLTSADMSSMEKGDPVQYYHFLFTYEEEQ